MLVAVAVVVVELHDELTDEASSVEEEDPRPKHPPRDDEGIVDVLLVELVSISVFATFIKWKFSLSPFSCVS